MEKLTPPLRNYSKGCKIWLIINTILYMVLFWAISGIVFKIMFLIMTVLHMLLLFKPYKEEQFLLVLLSVIICLVELFHGAWGGMVLLASFTLITLHFTMSAYSTIVKQPSKNKTSDSHPIGIYIFSVFLILMGLLWGIITVFYIAFPKKLYPFYYGMEYIWYGDTSFIENQTLATFIGIVFLATQISVAIITLLHIVIIANIFGLPLDVCPLKRRRILQYKGLKSFKYFIIYRNSLTFSAILVVISILNTFPRTEVTNEVSGLGFISLILLLILSRLAKKRMNNETK